MINALLRYPLFRLLGPERLALWTELGRSRIVEPGEELFHEGAPGRSIVIVRSGRLRITRADEQQRERSLALFGPGVVFGEYALLEPHINTAGCRASERSEVVLLPIDPLLRVFRAIPGVINHLKMWLRLHALLHHFRYDAGLTFISAPSLVHLLNHCQELRFEPAHIIQTAGLLNHGWLYIQQGEVLLQPINADEQPTILGRGDDVGERALLGKSRLPTAVALTSTVCWYLSQDSFVASEDDRPSMNMQTFQPPRRRAGYPWIQQRYANDCGISALAMAFRHLGKDVNSDQLAALTPIEAGGATLTALASTASHFGYRPQPIRIGIEQLPHVQLPAIAHYSRGHYVTLFDVKPSSVIIGDPAEGIQEHSWAHFRANWSGCLLLLPT